MPNAMQRLIDENVIARLAQRDASLFADSVEARLPVMHRLGWVGNAAKAAERLPLYASITEQIISEGARDVVLLGMGGSSLASLVFAEVFGSSPGHPRLHVLDTTSPVTVSRLLSELDPATTWFLVSSKSGTTIEPLSLYAIFREWSDAALGRPLAGRHFIAITDPGTPLEELRKRENMRVAVPAPANVGGRFSALTVFGLMPATIIGCDVSELLRRAEEMERRCEVPSEENPAADLASWIAATRDIGCDTLTIAASGRYSSFALWVEQLVAESTGKRGIGVLPVPEYAFRMQSGFGPDRAVVVVRSADDLAASAWAKAARVERHPVLELELADPLDLGAEFVRWEYAVAMVGYLLGVNPFDEPDVAAAKAATLEVLDGAQVAQASADIDGAWVTYAGALATPDPAPATLADALAPALAALDRGGGASSRYVALLAYLPLDGTRLSPLRQASMDLGAKTAKAVCLEVGPRYLHSTGQLHKGGPDGGIFIVITARDREDLPIPGQPFTLARLHRAQAEGDLLALAERGRHVVRVDLPDSRPATVARLADALLCRSRSA